MAPKSKVKGDAHRNQISSSSKASSNDSAVKLKDSAGCRTRTYLILGFIVAVAAVLIGWSLSHRGHVLETLASATDSVKLNVMKVDCSRDYDGERQLYLRCLPQWCGRAVMDSVVSPADASQLLGIAKSGFSYGGSDGGASILDLHSGALSKGSRFINIYTMMSSTGTEIFSKSDFILYSNVKNSIQAAVAEQFGIDPERLYLTKPTFFSRMTTETAKTIHDEYWHVHVDKETYGSFHYTSLLYLSDYGSDFTGGRFTFVDDGNFNVTVEPKLGRLSFFTSGSENKHFVERLESGTRYAITVSFTCDATKAIQDPEMPKE